MKTVLVLVVLWVAIVAEYASYKGYKVFQLQPSNEDQLDLIENFRQNDLFDFWSLSKVVGLPTTIMVAPEVQTSFMKTLEETAIPYTVIIEDLERVIQQERNHQLANPKLQGSKISFNAYNRYETIQNYLEELAVQYPDIVSLEDIGSSYEGRKISMIKIGAASSDNPIILVDAGIHAREWISPAFALYLIRELVENEQNRNMIEKVNWFIIPVLNPDGYEYTHTNERFWRKTRSQGSRCKGVDGNRNFDFHWRETGASSYECDETYAGPYAFSEPETSALRDVVKIYYDKIKLYLTFHSYGNYLLYPWGYTSNLPDNVDELDGLAKAVAAAIASVSGTEYTIGSSTNVLYAAAGGSDDWVKGVGGVELSYTIELPGGGTWGFDLPASKIMDVCIETFEGVKVYHNYTLFYTQKQKKNNIT